MLVPSATDARYMACLTKTRLFASVALLYASPNFLKYGRSKEGRKKSKNRLLHLGKKINVCPLG